MSHPLINPDSKHYAMFDGVEAIERLEQLFSVEELKAWAKISAFKYRLRVGHKGESTDWMSDIKKIKTFEDYYKYLESRNNDNN